jgi:hypothetical protein
MLFGQCVTVPSPAAEHVLAATTLTMLTIAMTMYNDDEHDDDDEDDGDDDDSEDDDDDDDAAQSISLYAAESQ